MDTKIEIKEEDPLSDVASQIEREFFLKDVTMKTNSDAVLLDDDCDVAIKTEVKSETPFPDFYSQEERECSTKHFLKQNKSETFTCSDNCEIDTKTEIEEQTLISDFGSQNAREFLPEDPVMKDKKYNNDHEVDNKIEIKEEPWWQETEASSVCDSIKDGDFPPVKSSRLFMEAVSGDSSGISPLLSAKVSGRDISFCNRKDRPEYESQPDPVTEIQVTHVVTWLYLTHCTASELMMWGLKLLKCLLVTDNLQHLKAVIKCFNNPTFNKKCKNKPHNCLEIQCLLHTELLTYISDVCNA